MISGPVFEFELLTTARRGRYYLTRAAYGLVLLYVFYLVWLGWTEPSGGVLTPGQVSRFALSTFGWMAAIQVVLVLALTPALTAGVIAAEKQRKTLHYVLASSLTGVEVVLGKLLSRMLHVGVLLGVGFPVLSMLVLLGGVDPRLVVLACGAAASVAFFLAALSLLVSVYARRVREALFVAYALEFLWLVGTEGLRNYGYWLGPIAGVFEPLNEWVLATNPIHVGRTVLIGLITGSGSIVIPLAWMIGLQAAAGAGFVTLAAWRLRPVFRKQEGGLRPSRVLSHRPPQRWRLGGRPEPSDDPMDWKERFTSRGTALTRIVGLLAALAFVVPIVVEVYRLAPAAFFEMLGDNGAPHNWFYAPHRTAFRQFLMLAVSLLFVLCGVSAAGAAAASIASEHEGDTWVSLTATDLTGREIVLSKTAGAIWGVRRMLVALMLLVLLGVVCGAVHPFGMAVATVSIAVFITFAAAFGVLVSLQFRSTWRAQFMTIAGLLLLNLTGQAVLNMWRSDISLIWPGFMPVHVGAALFAPDHFARFVEGAKTFLNRPFSFDDLNWNPFWSTVLDVLAVLVYGALTALLAWGALWSFERAAGRPRRSRLRGVAAKARAAEPSGTVEPELS